MVKYSLDIKTIKEFERKRSRKLRGFEPVFQMDLHSSTYKLDGI